MSFVTYIYIHIYIHMYIHTNLLQLHWLLCCLLLHIDYKYSGSCFTSHDIFATSTLIFALPPITYWLHVLWLLLRLPRHMATICAPCICSRNWSILCMCVDTYSCVCVCVYMCVCACVCVCVCACVCFWERDRQCVLWVDGWQWVWVWGWGYRCRCRCWCRCRCGGGSGYGVCV